MNLTFLPWARQGLAAALTSPAPAARPSVSVKVKLQQGAQPARTIDVATELFGPGDVVAIDRSAVIRTFPAPGGQLTDDTLVAVELDRADFPWLFTPNAPAGGKLMPWLQLLVVEPRSGVRLEVRAGQNAVLHLEGAAVVAAELPRPDEAWAFAHAQVAGVNVTDRAALEALVRDKPAQSSSRLLAARKLEKGRRYVACLVPTWELGRRTGLGLPVEGAGLAFAWSVAAAQVELPVYFHWELECSDQGGFREQVEQLTPRKLDARVGARAAFATPAPGLKKGFAFELPGVLRAFEAQPSPLPAADAQRFAGAVDALQANKKTLVPPRYGEGHAPQGPWVGRLNRDPSLRAAAALGTRVVQQQQEALIAAVHEQLERPAPAMAEAAREVNRAMLRRFFGAQEQAKASPEIVARVTAFATRAAPAASTPATPATTPPAVAPNLLPAVRRLSTISGRASLMFSARRLSRGVFTPPEPGIASFQRGGPAMPSPLGIAPATVDAWPKALLFKLVDERADFPLGLAVVNAKIELKTHRVRPVRPRPVVIRDHRRLDDVAEPEPIDDPLEVVDTVLRNLTNLRASVPWRLHQAQPQDNVDSADATLFRPAARAVQQWLAPLMRPLIITGVFQPLTFATAAVQPATAKLVMPVVAPPVTAPATSPLGIRYPMWRTLVELAPEAMLPHLERVPMNTVGLLAVNGPVIEAFLAGLNHELLREVRWRKVPVKGAPTFFDSMFTAEPEVPPLDAWNAEGNLKAALRDAAVLLLRGGLIRNQPRVTIYAAREGQPATAPAFEGALDESTRFVGFPIAAAALSDPGQRWRFVLEEQPTEPCFTAPRGAAPGPLRATAFAATSSAQLAQSSLRRPFRVVIPAVDLLP
ncbi:MAG: hypothetical protein IT380_12365 [Myxococcales bacterium]|nr:hypothetical protein [Myxococcales bacterium]